MNRTRSNRRILLLCTLLVCLVSMLMIRFSAAAEENVIPETRQLPRLVDRADLLSELEEEELEARLDEISERQAADVVVVTVNSLDGKSAQDYADDFYGIMAMELAQTKAVSFCLSAWRQETGILRPRDSGSERSRMLVLITYRISSCLI